VTTPALEGSAGPATDAGAPSARDMQIVAAILSGDEAAFEALVRRYHESMVRIAITFVRSRAVAEEVAQETWIATLNGLDGFEGRAPLRTWLFRILTKRAITRGVREQRTVPFSALVDDDDDPMVPAERFLGADRPLYPGHWATPPRRWDELPEARLLARETREQVLAAVDELPPAQRAVVVLRDLQGLDAAEACELLDLSDGNQRVLLHRARAKVRAALEAYFDQEAA
jgi:RNA polymerase sigma-70 factor (ECF subfamily)